jgi:hypothetical protein
MSLSHQQAVEMPRSPRQIDAEKSLGRALLLTAFAGAIFFSAALLFAVQPMFTKMVLPRFGGTPSVWSMALVFFQSALLAGYAYAHWLTRIAPMRVSVLAHLLLMALAAFGLPLSIAGNWGRPPDFGEALWLIALFTASIGLPFFALAANGPLLQAWLVQTWLARSGEPAAKDPYFLYVASNLGSFVALVSYPVLIEPFVRLTDQSRFWSAGFIFLIALIAACGVALWRSPPESVRAPDWEGDASPGWRVAVRWVALAAVPSALLLAVTAHIGTDVAAVPLLCVVPLALYLLSFVIAFQRRPVVPHRLVLVTQPLFVLALAGVIVFAPVKTMLWLIGIHLAAFFICALMCHGELARTRPSARHLTAFYLCIAAGGAVGGLAAGLLAPHAFDWVAEYPVLLALALLCHPIAQRMRSHTPHLMLAAVVFAAVLPVITLLWPTFFDERTFLKTAAVLLAIGVLLWRAPPLAAGIVASVLLAHHMLFEQAGAVSFRSFFGVTRVLDSPDHQFRLLAHGTTLHGAQRIRDPDGAPVGGMPEPLLYYWHGSGISQTIDAVRTRIPGPMRYAVIGLGTGSLACRAGPDDLVHYYEIDPAIVRIAREPALFSFISVCRPDLPITVGDARLTLSDAPDATYDLIIIDAFSSDAIPAHLLTREAMAVYLRRLDAHGMIVIHVSNRHLELASVVAGIAAANRLVTLINEGGDLDEAANPYKFGATVTASVRETADFGLLGESPEWHAIDPDPRQRVWTDDYSDIFGSMLRKLRE